LINPNEILLILPEAYGRILMNMPQIEIYSVYYYNKACEIVITCIMRVFDRSIIHST